MKVQGRQRSQGLAQGLGEGRPGSGPRWAELPTALRIAGPCSDQGRRRAGSWRQTSQVRPSRRLSALGYQVRPAGFEPCLHHPNPCGLSFPFVEWSCTFSEAPMAVPRELVTKLSKKLLL